MPKNLGELFECKEMEMFLEKFVVSGVVRPFILLTIYF